MQLDIVRRARDGRGVVVDICEYWGTPPANIQTQPVIRDQVPAWHGWGAIIAVVMDIAPCARSLPASFTDKQVIIIITIDIGERGEGMRVVCPGQGQL